MCTAKTISDILFADCNYLFVNLDLCKEMYEYFRTDFLLLDFPIRGVTEPFQFKSFIITAQM